MKWQKIRVGAARDVSVSFRSLLLTALMALCSHPALALDRAERVEAAVTGSVRTADGVPIAGASVSVHRRDDARPFYGDRGSLGTTESREDGAFELVLDADPGPVVVSARTPGHAVVREDCVLGGRCRAEFRLPPAVQLRVRVSQPCHEWEALYLLDAAGVEREADLGEDCVAMFESVAPGRALLYPFAGAVGSEIGSGYTAALQEPTFEWNVVPRRNQLTVALREGSQPAGGIECTITHHGPKLTHSITAVTDRNGRVVFRDLEPGSWTLGIEKEGKYHESLETIELGPGTNVTLEVDDRISPAGN